MPTLPKLYVPEYSERVLGLDPIAYWLLDEKQGNVAYCQVNPAQNGVYTGVTLGQPGIGDGRTCPFFDGANDFVDIHNAALVAAFNGSEGTVLLWVRVFNAAVWADGITRYSARVFSSVAGNEVRPFLKAIAANQMDSTYLAGGVAEFGGAIPGPRADWFPIAMTWSKSAGVNGEVRNYVAGIQSGATAVALGVWGGIPVAGGTIIGAGWTTPSNVWHGYLAHCAVWDRPLTPYEVWMLYRWRDETEGRS